METKALLAGGFWLAVGVFVMPYFQSKPHETVIAREQTSSGDVVFLAGNGSKEEIQANVFVFAKEEANKAKPAMAKSAAYCAKEYADDEPHDSVNTFMSRIYTELIIKVSSDKEGKYLPEQLSESAKEKTRIYLNNKKGAEEGSYSSEVHAIAGVFRNYEKYEACVYRNFEKFVPDKNGKLALSE